MRMTIELSEAVMNDVMRLTGAKTKKEALAIALADYVRRKSVEALLDAAGTMDVEYVRPGMEEAELTSSYHSTEYSTGSATLRKVAERRKSLS